MNIAWCQRIYQDLLCLGVRDIVECAGARNSPLIMTQIKYKMFRSYSFFEERCASFFALGVARRTGRPVAVVTTSGTAVAELLPAAIEAFHSGVPLILLTADRPRRLRGTAAPQTIDQVNLFTKFVSFEVDLEKGQELKLANWNRRAPAHINICFDEPLVEAETGRPDHKPVTESGCARDDWRYWGRTVGVASETRAPIEKLLAHLESPGPGVVLVGSLETESERQAVCEFLIRYGVPVYLEGTSGLREDPRLASIALRSGEQILSWGLKTEKFSRVLRIGGVPTARLWRDLEAPNHSVSVLSLSPLPWSGLSRGDMICTDLAKVLTALGESPKFSPSPNFSELDQLKRADQKGSEHLAELLREHPQSEQGLIFRLSQLITKNTHSLEVLPTVFIGNSLPIRTWDLVASPAVSIAVRANRGANGIDGQLSTFFGGVEDGRENWVIVGDLTALYDLAAPWAMKYCDRARVRIVVVNNGGGKIFSRIFARPEFENRHSLDFQHWSKMWGFSYHRWAEVPNTFDGGHCDIIEVVPCPQATEHFDDLCVGFWESWFNMIL